ncbi:AAA family ATPase [Evansella sp. AB-P1]|uniref:AAA family ATPase n=1 Tax=Evansella sp. AB-P1 TaxID=3037653 RepID=UPI00241CDEC1|nr:AAA family ATPase [Evansella sp. AB-P1]MDG5789915.1 AAA family ATPase [Evansella sp. AB-P1]
MNQEKSTIKGISDQIEQWTQLPFHKLKEPDILRTLNDLESKGEEHGEFKENKAIILAMGAAARFNRKQSIDEKAETRLAEAYGLCQDNTYVNEVVLFLSSYFLSTPIFSEDIPKIRETDHSQGKKKTINVVNILLSEGENIVNQLLHRMEQYELSASKMGKAERVKEAINGNEILSKVKRIINEAKHASNEYRESISGIYSSKEKLEVFHEALDQLRDLAIQWDRWKEAIEPEKEMDGLKQLNSLVGLSEVKEKVYNYYHYLIYEKERRKQGYKFQDEQSLNMILTGNPGTGKTELARLLARIYFDLGVLPRETVYEVDRSHLVGAYVGQTEEKTINVIKEAVGGVLFIDEAYSLKRDSATGTDYGQTAIDTIVAAMTSGEYAGKFAVILAGYPEEMRSFLWSNPGLRSRFPESNHIHLSDYSIDELMEIGEQVALDNDFTMTADAMKALKEKIEKFRVDESFGNARTVKNIILEAIFQKGSQIGKSKSYSNEDFAVLDKSAFQLSDKVENSKSSEEELNELIGLEKVKEQVKMLASFVKIQKARQEKGLPQVPIQLHAIFTGPPGTGKTTVASIYSKILNELGLLKRGHLIVAGRSDLVAGYVGQTAIKTKKKVREALGGVLFIDEAYSLFSKGNGDFGKEAIDTLVEEMTKHNENLVVILAGYPESIDPLMESNPGLQSRFKKVIEFPSYTSEEMIQILLYYVEKLGYNVTEEAVQFITEMIKDHKPSGNGRKMKDVVEVAIQKQAYRLVSKDVVDEDTLMKLEKEDFINIIKGEE